jgi:hypothetical protein
MLGIVLTITAYKTAEAIFLNLKTTKSDFLHENRQKSGRFCMGKRPTLTFPIQNAPPAQLFCQYS